MIATKTRPIGRFAETSRTAASSISTERLPEGRVRRSFWTWMLAFACAGLGALATPRQAAAQVAAKQVETAINDAVLFLKRRQARDGTWYEWPGCESGTVALCTLALLTAGVPPEDDNVQRALSYLRTRAPREKVYAVSLQTMALCAARDDADLGLILKNARWLESAQLADGAWGYSPGDQISDNSNAQFAMLALHEAERYSDKVRVSQRVWDKALQYWQSCQNADGSWGYRLAGERRGSGSMTCAGITSVLIAAGKRHDPDPTKLDCCSQPPANRSLERGLDWMKRNFSVQRNPGNAQAWLLYYLYGLERVGRLSANRFLGAHDWYREGTEKLLRERDAIEGSWVGVGSDETHANVATCLALLFLAKGRRPVVVGKLKYSGGDAWNQHPEDAANLVSYVEARWKRELSFQVVDLKSASVDDLLQVPVLYISGKSDPKFDDQEITKLRDYVLRGGFIFAEACCDGREFDDAFDAAIEKMFKAEGLSLKPLPPEHPVWRMEDVIPPNFVGELFGVNVSCRTSVVFSRRDLSCAWNHADPRRMRTLHDLGERSAPVRRQISDALAVGLNVVAYATNRQVKFKYEQFDLQNERESVQGTGRGLLRIAQVVHGGGADAAASAVPNLQRALAKIKTVRTAIESKSIPLTDGTLPDFPLLFMHGRNQFAWTAEERKSLRQYLDRGGVMLADAVCGSREFDHSFRDEIAAVFPEAKLQRIPPDHPIYSNQFGGFDVRQVRRREPVAAGPNQPFQIVERTVEPQLDGIKIGDRWVVIYSSYDISCALENHSAVDCRGYVSDDAIRLGVNAVLYGLLQSGP